MLVLALYSSSQLSGLVALLPITIYAVVIADAPLGSLYVAANAWLCPLPVAGDTERAVGAELVTIPPCVTVKVWPAIVNVPARWLELAFAAIE